MTEQRTLIRPIPPLGDRIVVMDGGQPGRIAAEVLIDLARPRTRGNASFNATREAVLAALGDARPAAARRSSEVTGIR